MDDNDIRKNKETTDNHKIIKNKEILDNRASIADYKSSNKTKLSVAYKSNQANIVNTESHSHQNHKTGEQSKTPVDEVTLEGEPTLQDKPTQDEPTTGNLNISNKLEIIDNLETTVDKTPSQDPTKTDAHAKQIIDDKVKQGMQEEIVWQQLDALDYHVPTAWDLWFEGYNDIADTTLHTKLAYKLKQIPHLRVNAKVVYQTILKNLQHIQKSGKDPKQALNQVIDHYKMLRQQALDNERGWRAVRGDKDAISIMRKHRMKAFFKNINKIMAIIGWLVVVWFLLKRVIGNPDDNMRPNYQTLHTTITSEVSHTMASKPLKQ